MLYGFALSVSLTHPDDWRRLVYRAERPEVHLDARDPCSYGSHPPMVQEEQGFLLLA